MLFRPSSLNSDCSAYIYHNRIGGELRNGSNAGTTRGTIGHSIIASLLLGGNPSIPDDLSDGVSYALSWVQQQMTAIPIARETLVECKLTSFGDRPCVEGTADLLIIQHGRTATLNDWKFGTWMDYPPIERDRQQIAYAQLACRAYSLKSILVSRVHVEAPEKTQSIAWTAGEVDREYSRQVMPLLRDAMDEPLRYLADSNERSCEGCLIQAQCPAWIGRLGEHWWRDYDPCDPTTIRRWIAHRGAIRKACAALDQAAKEMATVPSRVDDQYITIESQTRWRIKNHVKACADMSNMGITPPEGGVTISAIRKCARLAGYDSDELLEELAKGGAIEQYKTAPRAVLRDAPEAMIEDWDGDSRGDD